MVYLRILKTSVNTIILREGLSTPASIHIPPYTPTHHTTSIPHLSSFHPVASHLYLTPLLIPPSCVPPPPRTASPPPTLFAAAHKHISELLASASAAAWRRHGRPWSGRGREARHLRVTVLPQRRPDLQAVLQTKVGEVGLLQRVHQRCKQVDERLRENGSGF